MNCDEENKKHNWLEGLQGGTVSERYHLTQEQWHAVTTASGPGVPTIHNQNAKVQAGNFWIGGKGKIDGTPTDDNDVVRLIDLNTIGTTYVLLSGIYDNPTWLNTLQWSKITGKPTTLQGYGITDAVQNQNASAQTANFWINGAGRSTNYKVDNSPVNPTDVVRLVDLTWINITSVPTTLAGYGITDAIRNSDVYDGDSQNASIHVTGLIQSDNGVSAGNSNQSSSLQIGAVIVGDSSLNQIVGLVNNSTFNTLSLEKTISGATHYLHVSGPTTTPNSNIYATDILDITASSIRLNSPLTATSATFSGDVTVPTATLSTQAVNKAQLDLKANIATTLTGYGITDAIRNSAAYGDAPQTANINLTGGINTSLGISSASSVSAYVLSATSSIDSGGSITAQTSVSIYDQTVHTSRWVQQAIANNFGFTVWNNNSGFGVYDVSATTQVLTFTKSPIVPTATTNGQAVNLGQLASYEVVSNKTNTISSSTTQYPSVKAIQDYAIRDASLFANVAQNSNIMITGIIGASSTTLSGPSAAFYLYDRVTPSTSWLTYSTSTTLHFQATGVGGDVYTVDHSSQVLTFPQSPIVPNATTSTQAVNKSQLDTKQNTLVSGTTIKTINGASILSAGDLSLITGVVSSNGDIGYGTNGANAAVVTLNSGSGGGQIVKRDGSGNISATSFWGNASTATTSTQWNGYTLDTAAYSTGFDYVFGRTTGTAQARLISAAGLQAFLGLGSNAYTSTAYLTAESDTLQSVTNRGATTTTSITASAFYQTSQRELKTNIEVYTEDALASINSLKVNTFNFKSDLDEKQIGFVIDEIQDMSILNTTKTAINKDNLIAQLTKAVQQLTERLERIENA